jgi:imidazolonepropionase-like amidohydrolase
MGMSPLAALQSATINAADLMGLNAKTGCLEAGKWADIVAVDKNPLDDVRILQNVKFVMKAGVVYKNEGK